MAQPLYFLPGLSRSQLLPGGKLSRSLLAGRGLGEIFDDVGVGRDDFATAELAGRGPGNKSGIFLCYHTPAGEVPRRVDYRPDEQAWHEAGDGLWIGLDTDDPPTPLDLSRRKQHAGYRLELADGQSWVVPVIRRPDGTTELPTDLYWDTAGKLVEPLKERYRAYWDQTAEVAEWFFGEKGFDAEGFEKGKALELAVRALGLNYRFGRAEQNVLRVVDRENFLTVLAYTVDVPKAVLLSESQKKSSDLTSVSTTSTGPEGDTPDTGQAAPNLGPAPAT